MQMTNRAGRASMLRQTIEAEMTGRFAGALSPRALQVRPMLPFAIPALDLLTGGGIPTGAVTELYGAGSTGKTGAVMKVVAGAMRAGKVCAWVDAGDSFDPATGVENGIVLQQLLWVRCGAARPLQSQAGASMLAAKADRTYRAMPGRCGSHPRGEEQGLDHAVSGLFQSASTSNAQLPAERSGGSGPQPIAKEVWPDASRTGMHSTRNRQTLGTPGAPNQPLSAIRGPSFHPVKREEQVATDRQGGRKLQNSPDAFATKYVQVPQRRSANLELSQQGSAANLHPKPAKTLPRHDSERERPWSRLDQALRAADLLLQGGGFSVVVLDLGHVAREHVLRIPSATWFRFRAVAEASGAAFVLISQAPCTSSSAGLVLQIKPMRLHLAGGTVGEWAEYGAELARQRFRQAEDDAAVPRKQPQATWESSPYCVPLMQIEEPDATGSSTDAGPRKAVSSAPLLAWAARPRRTEQECSRDEQA